MLAAWPGNHAYSRATCGKEGEGTGGGVGMGGNAGGNEEREGRE